MTFARDQWYVAAYGREVGRELLARTVCGEPIVFYRTEAGEAVALADRCVHRRYPALASQPAGRRQGRLRLPRLHLRRRRRCVSVPGQKRIPRTARVARLPGGRAGLVRLGVDRRPRRWPTRPRSRAPRGSPPPAGPPSAAWSRSRPGYGLLVDNLMDLSHETYLHGGYIGTPEVAETPITTEVDEDRGIVYVSRHMDDAECPPFYAESTGIEGRITRWQDIEYHAAVPVPAAQPHRAGRRAARRRTAATRDAFHVEIVYAITPRPRHHARLLGGRAGLRARRRGGHRLPAREQPHRGACRTSTALERAGAGHRHRAGRLPGAEHQHRHRRRWPRGGCSPALVERTVSRSAACREHAHGDAVYRMHWLPGTDRLRGVCHCGAEREAEDPVAMWEWLLAHPQDTPRDARASSSPRDGRSRPARDHCRRRPPQGAASPTDVVALTLRAPRRRRAARLGSPAPTSTCPAARPGAPVLAVRRPGRPPAWRVAVLRETGRPRRLARTCTTSSPRATRCGCAGRATTSRCARRRPLPVHRRRHRHHADPADGRRGRGRAGPTGGWSTAGGSRASWRSSTSSAAATATGCSSARRTRPACSTSTALLGEPRAGHAGLLLRPGAAAGRGRGALRGLARRAPCTSSGSRPTLPAGAGARPRPFEVELARSPGCTLTVPPDRSILEVVEEAGVAVLSSCREGTCGTCETAVLDGVPDHRDSLLTEDERAADDTMMICVSRSVAPKLVLDL